LSEGLERHGGASETDALDERQPISGHPPSDITRVRDRGDVAGITERTVAKPY